METKNVLTYRIKTAESTKTVLLNKKTSQRHHPKHFRITVLTHWVFHPHNRENHGCGAEVGMLLLHWPLPRPALGTDRVGLLQLPCTSIAKPKFRIEKTICSKRHCSVASPCQQSCYNTHHIQLSLAICQLGQSGQRATGRLITAWFLTPMFEWTYMPGRWNQWLIRPSYLIPNKVPSLFPYYPKTSFMGVSTLVVGAYIGSPALSQSPACSSVPIILAGTISLKTELWGELCRREAAAECSSES